jgi:hypothetical protein
LTCLGIYPLLLRPGEPQGKAPPNQGHHTLRAGTRHSPLSHSPTYKKPESRARKRRVSARGLLHLYTLTALAEGQGKSSGPDTCPRRRLQSPRERMPGACEIYKCGHSSDPIFSQVCCSPQMRRSCYGKHFCWLVSSLRCLGRRRHMRQGARKSQGIPRVVLA